MTNKKANPTATGQKKSKAGYFRIVCITGLLLWLLLPAPAHAQYNYTTNNGTITFARYTGSESEVVIPSTINGLPVTSIGEQAFAGCTSLASINIPDSVTSIGGGAFCYCSSLASIAIPNSVTSIGDGAFYGCTSLTSITIGNGVTSIGPEAFENCASLISITIPNSVTSIGSGAFYRCTSLASITIPNSVTNIGRSAFDGLGKLTSLEIDMPVISFSFANTTLTNIVIGNSVKSIGDNAFKDCARLASINIPDSVTSIGSGAFCYCSSLASIAIPNSVTNIGSSAFSFCSKLTSVTLGNSVASIGGAAFNFCGSLRQIYFQGNAPALLGSPVLSDNGNTTVYYLAGTKGWTLTFGGRPAFSYTSVDGVLYGNNQTILIQYPRDKAGSFTIPNSVINIGSWAFYDCTNLTNITIPDSVATIGQLAFGNCQSLDSITIPSRVNNLGPGALSDCTSLKGVFFQGDAPTLGSSVFNGDNNATVYYLHWTKGWSSTFGGMPAMVWSLPFPVIPNNNPYFGALPEGFCFVIAWHTNRPVVVDTCTNLANPAWYPLATNTVTVEDNLVYFSDPQWKNYPKRYYRVRPQ